jgi:LacI family transcriptional regulator
VARSVTIKDVARAAGVSPATVSLVLNQTPGARVAADTAVRVRAVADRLGYAPNALARGLRRQRSDTIAVLSDMVATTPFAVGMFAGVQQVARHQGLVVVLLETGGDPDAERAAVRTLARQRVDGVLYARMWHQVVQVPDGLGGPLVLLDARTTADDVPAVVPDDRGGARTAAAELLAHGHRRIAMLTDAAGSLAARLREAGYRDALTDCGVPIDPRLLVAVDADVDAAQAAIERLCEREFTALFCFNDRLAIGAYRALRARGLVVPADVSVVGFDDQPFVAAYAEPPLTTVALPHHAMGARAAERLLHAIHLTNTGGPGEREPDGELTELIPCHLVRRASVAVAPTRPRTGPAHNPKAC